MTKLERRFREGKIRPKDAREWLLGESSRKVFEIIGETWGVGKENQEVRTLYESHGNTPSFISYFMLHVKALEFWKKVMKMLKKNLKGIRKDGMQLRNN